MNQSPSIHQERAFLAYKLGSNGHLVEKGRRLRWCVGVKCKKRLFYFALLSVRGLVCSLMVLCYLRGLGYYLLCHLLRPIEGVAA